MDKIYHGDDYKGVYAQTQKLIPVLRSLDRRIEGQKDLYGGDIDLVDEQNGRRKS